MVSSISYARWRFFIQRTANHSIADRVLCPPKPPGAVVYLDLGYREALHLGEGREEPVHAIEELHVFQAFFLKCLQGTSRVDDLLLTQLISHEVGYLGGNDLDPRISPYVSPSADHIEPPYFLQKTGYVMRIILKIGIHGHHNIALGSPETGVEGRRLTGVLSEADYPYLRIMCGSFLQYPKAAILASVIYKYNLRGLFCPLQYLAQLRN